MQNIASKNVAIWKLERILTINSLNFAHQRVRKSLAYAEETSRTVDGLEYPTWENQLSAASTIGR